MYGLDLYGRPCPGQRAAKPVNINFHCVGSEVTGQTKQLIFDLTLWHDATTLAQQHFKNRTLACRQGMRRTVNHDLSKLNVEGDIADSEAAAGESTGPPLQGLQPGDKFLHRERFDEIVVGTRAQPRNAVTYAIAGCQHQYRYRLAATTQISQEIQTIAIRQSEVEHDSPILHIGKGLVGILGGIYGINFEIVPRELFSQQRNQFRVILDEKQPQWHSPPTLSSSTEHVYR